MFPKSINYAVYDKVSMYYFILIVMWLMYVCACVYILYIPFSGQVYLRIQSDRLLAKPNLTGLYPFVTISMQMISLPNYVLQIYYFQVDNVMKMYTLDKFVFMKSYSYRLYLNAED